MPRMTVGRYAGTPIDQLPNSYLRWMLQQDFPQAWLDIAKKKVEESLHSDDYLSISRHAIDTFSIRFLDRWERTLRAPGAEKVGLGTFIAKLALRAFSEGVDVSKHRHQDDGIVKQLEGIRFVFKVNEKFPDYKDLITVMPVD